MTLKVPNQGEADLLKASLNVSGAAEDLELCLYKNDKVPADSDTEDDYDEATFTGYAAISLDSDDWSVSPGNPTEAVQPVQTFESAAGSQNQNIYGYFVRGASSGRLKWAERFTDGPYDVVNLGDKIEVQPRFTGSSEG